MNKILYDVLENLNEGVVLTNDKLNIDFWNGKMEQVSKINKKDAVGKNIFEILPQLNKDYFNKSINAVLKHGSKMFFAAAMHANIIPGNDKYNIKISRLSKDESKFLFIEFINVTNEFVRINELKKYINELNVLNTELKHKEKIISNLAYYDNLTGIGNRTLFYEQADKMLESAKINNSIVALMFIDVDNFKSINDTYGHDAGDKALVRVANMLTESIRNYDIVARFGGDEFVLMFSCPENTENYKKVVSRIIQKKDEMASIGEVKISLSIGISFYPHDGDNIQKLIRKADKAMYLAKKNEQKNKFFYSFCF